MIALDTNLPVYAHRSDSPFHKPAKELLESLRGQLSPWAIPWPCLHEFVAVVTHPRVFKTPTPIEACFACIDAWHAGDNLHLIGESDGYLGKLHRIATAARSRGPLIHEARVAAICLHHGVGELWSAELEQVSPNAAWAKSTWRIASESWQPGLPPIRSFGVFRLGPGMNHRSRETRPDDVGGDEGLGGDGD